MEAKRRSHNCVSSSHIIAATLGLDLTTLKRRPETVADTDAVADKLTVAPGKKATITLSRDLQLLKRAANVYLVVQYGLE
jgi:hypothetical protein